MPNQQEKCYDNQLFNRFLDEQVEEHEEARILAHIGNCERCRIALEKLAGRQEIWSDIKRHFGDHQIEFGSDETRDLDHRDRQRDLQKVQNLLAPTDDPSMLGRLGAYEVCGVIGRGSAGIVVKALDRRLNRSVAIKLLAPAYSNNGCSRRRFEREGRAIASVKNPHVVPIHSVDEFQGTPYIVMPYMPNGSLQQRILNHGPLTTREVVCVGMQIAIGLAAAHKRGIVHRDVKPANVLLENGVEGAMVTDFGLARVVDEATMTHSGSISGTPQYMSPEQAKGERVDQRSDLFSLGSTMYAACTGHAPFQCESVFGIIKRVCESEPKPISEFNPDIDEWLVAFIHRLHSKNPESRFKSAEEVADLLSSELAFAQAPSMVARPARAWWVNRSSTKKYGRNGNWITIAGGLALTALIAFGLWGWIGVGRNAGLFNSNHNGSLVYGNSNSPWSQTIALIQEENEKLPRFDQEIFKSIDVQSGGQLYLHTNLGAIKIETHEKSTVELKLVQTVAAVDQKAADQEFAALKIDYQSCPKEIELKPGTDAGIHATFPQRNNMTRDEVEQFTDLAELKKQLLIRNNNNFRNAIFTLDVPKNFHLSLHTEDGLINVANINGQLQAHTNGGDITTGDVTGKVELSTNGGHIETGNLDSDVIVHTNGGDIRTGNIAGLIEAKTNGGSIELDEVKGVAQAKTLGGSITIWKAAKAVQASSSGGAIEINFVGQPDGDSSLKTKAGSIEIGYVDGLKFDIDAACSLGKVSAPFSQSRSGRIMHQLNGGKNKLAAKTTAGSIYFKVIDGPAIDDQMKHARQESDEQSRGQKAFQRAFDLHMEGKLDEAIVAHQEAAKFEGFKAIATYNLGCAWALKGEKDKAFAALNDAIEFGFDDRIQFDEDEDLDSLREDDRFAELMSKLAEQEPDC